MNNNIIEDHLENIQLPNMEMEKGKVKVAICSAYFFTLESKENRTHCILFEKEVKILC